MKTRIKTSIMLGLLLVTLHAVAQMPRTISYQGLLTDALGNFLPDGNRTLTLKLYDNLASATPIYTESQTLPVVKGLFNAIIGSVVPIPNALTFDKAYFLGVSVDFGVELTPRTPLTASPYALRAERATIAESLATGATGVVTTVNGIQGTVLIQGGANTTVTQAGNSISIATIPASEGIKDLQSSDGSLAITNPTGPIATIALAPNKINSGHIIDGTIQASDLAVGVIPSTANFIQNGTAAGGDLTGAYPNPTIGNSKITSTHILDGTVQSTDLAPGVIPNTANFIQNGTASGGDLNGTYPNPTIGNSKVTSTHILDGTIQSADLAPGVIPNTANFIQNGTSAGGDLTGTYPNPTVGANKIATSQILDGTITPADISGVGANHNDALIYDAPMIGTPQWVIRKPVSIIAGGGINVITASAGPLLYNISAVDQSATNEIQSLSFNSGNKMLSLSLGGGTVDLASLSSGTGPWTTSGNNIFNNNIGNVGIGTNSPDQRLDVSGSVRIASTISPASLIFDRSGQKFNMAMRSNGQLAFEANGTTGDNTIVFDDGTDKSINIGTDVPRTGFKLNVTGKAFFANGLNFGSVEGFTDGGANQIACQGTLRPTTNNGFGLGNSTFKWSSVFATDGTINTSDARLKKNIKPLSSTLDQVMHLKVKTYNWNSGDDQSTKHTGFIAQDLLEFFPDLVVTEEYVYDENSKKSIKKPVEHLGVRYAEMIGILTKAIQEQQEQILKQKETINDLKVDLIRYRAEINKSQSSRGQ